MKVTGKPQPVGVAGSGPRGLAVGLVGAGTMARAHLPAWLALGARVAVWSAGGGAARLAEEYRAEGVTVAPDLDGLIGRSTVVDICTPTPSHPALALAAIAEGRSVVCEKPLALTPRDAAEIAGAAEAAGVLLFPAHVVRYFPAYEAAAASVARGELGEPTELRFTRGGAYPVWSPWFADPALSGGILMDLMIHDMDYARLLAGEVVSVRAEAQTTPNTAPGGARAEGTAVLTHASGAVSRLSATWGPADVPFRTTFRVTGTRGIVAHDSTAPTGLRAGSGTGDAPDAATPAGPAAESPYLTQLREFTAAFAGGPSPRVSARDAVAAVRIAAAAVLSARTGEAVDLTGDAEV
ncbi:Gfo/Idh/MocA family protein [Streptomyces sp. NPDC127068]|uniref:Gfo/Idh/MocA family protein n=1 Tax=Streptomyces sp. NPDC127068 TaxID=3347127 RepID=UPI00365C04ED